MKELIYNNPKRKNARRILRKNSTPEEDKLWEYLRNKKLGQKFKRQYSISGYIVDFYCPGKRLVIEIDGGQHIQNKEYDKNRTKLFNDLDIKVIRFWNSEIEKDIDTVLNKISPLLM